MESWIGNSVCRGEGKGDGDGDEYGDGGGIGIGDVSSPRSSGSENRLNVNRPFCSAK
jgi:hypothetical protein